MFLNRFTPVGVATVHHGPTAPPRARAIPIMFGHAEVRAGVTESLPTVLHRGVGLEDVVVALKRRPRRVLVLILIPQILALAVSTLLPRWYSSDATVTVDSGTQLPLGSSVVGLAAQLGLGGGAASSSPQFYADLLESRVILEHVLAARLPLQDSAHVISLLEFWSRGRPIDRVAHARALDRLSNHYRASANPRTGIITLTIEAPSKKAAALAVDTALAALNDLVVALRRRHAGEERSFLEGRYRDLHDTLAAHERDLQVFYERNRQISSPQLQFEELRLRREV